MTMIPAKALTVATCAVVLPPVAIISKRDIMSEQFAHQPSNA
jgi:hypothetical protein